MPPLGVPRPSADTYKSIATYLETELDRAAAAKPDPGRLPHLHRLTRTEYQNAIRDLLAVRDLPKEMDYKLLLPADNSSSGFDNIADLLFVSPVILERYLEAARKISRLAVGDPKMPEMFNIHRVAADMPQDERLDELPFGTRGGIAIKSYFPLDAEYQLRVEVSGAGREAHQIEISVDGERKDVLMIGSAGVGRTGRGGAPVGGDPEFRVPIKAGEHLVAVTFVQRTDASDEAVLRPRLRSRGTQPAIASVILTGPFNERGPGDTESRRRLFTCRPTSVLDEQQCVRQILSTLTARAYRRPSTDADVEALMPFYTAGKSEGNFDLGVQRALERVLVSPQFLYRIERDPAGGLPNSTYKITGLELASRLSFFLWSSIPDDELRDLGANGRLREPQVLTQQVKRMLADPRSESLIDNFAAQWLFLRDVALKEPDILLFRDFDQSLRRAFEQETELFLGSILRENRSVVDLLTANYTFVNERLAKHYGIPNVQGSYFRRIDLPPGSPRGGLLGQGSILSLTSYPTRTSPVLRGKYVLENLLAAAPPPPPPDIPALKTEASATGEALSMREAMELHRASPVCASCHARMDPIGLALENFDAIGRWRDRDNGKPLDVVGVFPDGTRFEGLAGLKETLAKDPERFVNTITEKLLMYAVGRNAQYFDAPAVRAIVRESAKTNYTFESLVLGVVNSPPFQLRTN